MDGAGMLSFPVPEAQVSALIASAERAPYGKGPDTLVDTSVRDCRQVGAERIRLAGGAWPETFAKILAAAASGLGCPVDRLDAQLYKLLVYERGGFFSAHRDTEKADGMIATLSISLPVAGEGGELIVRHGGCEIAADMHAEEPSELAFAAFYADCSHEVRPVTSGHRLSLVFNLCLRPGDKATPREAPDYGEQIDSIAKRLVAWRNEEDAEEKLVWLLDHEYSEAGLSFDTLKNADAARAQALAAAADRAECELHAAIVHIEEHGSATYRGEYVDSWGWNEGNVDDMEIDELFDGRHWLDGWADRGGTRPQLGELKLMDGELLPRGALDHAVPDEQRLHEASGNEGVSLERAYRHAALVLWPRSMTLAILAGPGIGGAVAWLAAELGRNSGAADTRIRRLASELVDMWPAGRSGHDKESRARMLGFLSGVGDKACLSRFLHDVILSHYTGSENEDLPASLKLVGPKAAGQFLPALVDAHFTQRPKETLDLLRRLREERSRSAGRAWNDVLREGVRSVLRAVSTAPAPRPPKQLADQAARDLFALAWHWRLMNEANTAADAHRRVVAARLTRPRAPRGTGRAARGEGAGGHHRVRDPVAPCHGLPAQAQRPLPRRSRATGRSPPTSTASATSAPICGPFARTPAPRSRVFRCGRSCAAICIGSSSTTSSTSTTRPNAGVVPTPSSAPRTGRATSGGSPSTPGTVSWMRRLIRSAPGGPQVAECAPDLARLQEAVAVSGRK